MSESTVERDPLEVLADEFAEKCRAGESPSISDYVGRLPDRENEIRELFPSVAMMERLRTEEDRDRATRAAAQSPSSGIPKQIGDYQILREIGSGGMGIVYESIQAGLERRVALKVMNAASVASAKQVQRFEREARAAAALHHTNIVPVFAVGTTNGQHYYAMQFINGVGLDEIVAAMRDAAATTFDGANDRPESSPPITPAANTADALRKGRFIRPRSPGSTDGLPLLQPALSGHSESSRNTSPTVPDPHNRNHASSLKPGDHYWKSVAMIGVQVADALHYAHSHGILHRDIKPQNLLIDREGNVWVTDFGLVKLMEHDNLTKTGDIVGTLGYMAPEQFHGQGDRTSDVFSLGVTLYELLTLTPAWRGAHKTVAAKRLNDDSIPAPRSINKAIPRDLETIILKATSSDRSARYQTAAEFAQDLQRFIDDRPILARRASIPERLARWSRRNPALAVSLGSVIALLVIIATMATLGRMRVETLLEDSTAARAKAEQSVDYAIDVLDSIVDNVAARGVPRSLTWSMNDSDTHGQESELTPSDARLLEDLLAFYKAFAADNSTDDRLYEKLAAALRQAGDIQMRLGRLADAEESYRAARERFAILMRKNASSHVPIRQFAATSNDLGQVLLRRGQFQQTLEIHIAARDFLLGQPKDIAAMPEIRFELARSVDLLASISIRSGAQEQPWIEQTDPPREFQEMDIPAIQQLIERIAPATDNGSEPPPATIAEALSRGLADACSRFEDLLRDNPDNEDYQLSLARSLRHQLSHAARTGDITLARHAFRESIRILESLIERSPDHPTWLFELADTLIHGATLDNPLEADFFLSRAVTYCERLLARYPNVAEYRLLQGSAFARRATILDALGLPDEAGINHRSAVTALRPLVVQYPDNGVYQIALAQARRNRAAYLRINMTSNRDAQESLALLETAVADFDSYLQNAQWSPFTAQIQSSLYEGLAETLTVLGRYEDADLALQQAAITGMLLP